MTTTPTIESQVCKTCGTEKPITDFYSNKKTGYIYKDCKGCFIIRQLQRHNGKFKDQSIPPKSETCDCCGKPLIKACLDHDHSNGKFRGWLCYNCNTGIGLLGDNEEGIIAALEYLVNL